ncbi:hypothetical protein [Desulfurobacterium crinifex]
MNNCYNYHVKSALTFESVRKSHYLDWSNYPNPFKVYKNVEKFPLLPFEGHTQETIDVLFRICGEGGEDNLSFQEISKEL